MAVVTELFQLAGSPYFEITRGKMYAHDRNEGFKSTNPSLNRQLITFNCVIGSVDDKNGRWPNQLTRIKIWQICGVTDGP